MSDFTHIVNVEGQGFLHFTFNCINSIQKRKFHVSVLTREPLCYHFVMEETYRTWKLIAAPRPPEWIIKLEPVLQDIIKKNTTRPGSILKIAL